MEALALQQNKIHWNDSKYFDWEICFFTGVCLYACKTPHLAINDMVLFPAVVLPQSWEKNYSILVPE